METIEYRWDDDEMRARREQWGDGPWQDEPDKIQFPDPATGYACLIRRHSRMGFLCGYVGVPPGHPVYGVDELPDDLLGPHGELNFTDFCDVDGAEGESICHVPGPGEPEPLYWIGFDCGHGHDVAPGLIVEDSRIARELGVADRPMFPWQKYRDVAYVKGACAALALQLEAMR